MGDTTFSSAAERIAFSEAADYIDQGRTSLIPDEMVQRYLRIGLWYYDGEQLRLTDEGLKQHHIATRERFSDG
ncbi:MAG TPA: hypothetical protein VGP22_04840 [Albitalea sp.]|jgi:hypothetical protein|nr:hypothetical protein [Albitalea sp.]